MLIEAADELRAAGEAELVDEVTALGKKLNDVIAPIRAAGSNYQRWDSQNGQS